MSTAYTYTSLFQLATLSTSEATPLPNESCLWCIYFRSGRVRGRVNIVCGFTGLPTTAGACCEFFAEKMDTASAEAACEVWAPAVGGDAI